MRYIAVINYVHRLLCLLDSQIH